MTVSVSSSPIAPSLAPPLENLFSLPGYRRLLALQFLFGVSYSSFLLLPKYLTEELHASATEVGRAAAVAVIAAAFLAPLVGTLSRFVSRARLITLAFALEGISALSFLAIERVGPGLYLARIAQGLSWAIVFNSTATLAADQVPSRQMSQAIGYLGLAMLATNALAPLVAEPLALLVGWKAVFVLAALFAGVGGAFFREPPGATRKPEGGPRTSTEGDGASVIAAILPLHLTSFAMGIGIGVMFTFTQPYALSLGAPRVGDFFLGYVAGAALVRTVFAKWPDRVGPPRAALLALLGYSVVVAGAALLSPALLVLLGLGIGMSHGILYPALTATGMTSVAPRARTRFMGWFSGAFNLGGALAMLGLGPVADHVGYPAVFVTGSLAMAFAIPSLARFARRANATRVP